MKPHILAKRTPPDTLQGSVDTGMIALNSALLVPAEQGRATIYHYPKLYINYYFVSILGKISLYFHFICDISDAEVFFT